MTWIRNPWYDSFWFLSGPLIGLALVWAQLPALIILSGFVTLNNAHLISPVAMAWSHDGYREVMWRRKIKFIYVPIAIIALGALLGMTASRTYPVNPLMLTLAIPHVQDTFSPFVALLEVYFVWDAYHFCMQNYGFLRIYRPRMDHALAIQFAMFVTLFGMIVIPTVIHAWELSVFCFGAVIINHQLAAIGLSSHVWANHRGRNPLWFAVSMITFGGGIAWLMLHAPEALLLLVVGLRAAFGLVHFLYDRRVYKLSNPCVRNTIGQNLFY